MPNTLAHIAIQTVITRSVSSWSGFFPLALLGCVIPDIPWILQRLVNVSPIAVDPYALRAYATVQASLFVSMIAAAAVSPLFSRPLHAFRLISIGCILHLLLDATEIKWGNGVNLFAPIEWSQVNWGVIWPDHIMLGITSLSGIAVFVLFAIKDSSHSPELAIDRRRTIAAISISVVYMLLPVAFIQEPFNANNHFLATLSNENHRTGQYIELDRADVFEVDGIWYARSYAGEKIRLIEFGTNTIGTYSLKGKFTSRQQITLSEWHRHDGYRDVASIIGLLLIMSWLVRCSIRQYTDGPEESRSSTG